MVPMATKITQCQCAHAFQDERYGKGNRVHNGMKKDGTGKCGHRCTVCGREKLAMGDKK